MIDAIENTANWIGGPKANVPDTLLWLLRLLVGLFVIFVLIMAALTWYGGKFMLICCLWIIAFPIMLIARF